MIAIRIIASLLAFFTSTAALADRESRQDREEREEREHWEAQSEDQDQILGCDDCRDLRYFPEDGANFSLNQVWGPDSWMTAGQADKFRIRDRYGNVIQVDLNLDLSLFSIPSNTFRFLPGGLPWPTDLKVQVLLRDRFNRLVHSDLLRPYEIAWPLPVGEHDPTSRTRYGSSDDEDEDVDDFSSEDYDDDTEFGEGWSDEELSGDECESCTAAFDADFDGRLDRDDEGEIIEYEL